MKRIGWLLVAIVLLVGSVPLQVGAVETGNLQVAGKSALLMDMATGTVLYESNAHARLAPASVTKVMTMLLIMEAIDSGKIGWDDTVTASETAAAKGGSQIYLKVGRPCPCRIWSNPLRSARPTIAPAPWQSTLPGRRKPLWV